jgi:ERCC4-type nuclease
LDTSPRTKKLSPNLLIKRSPGILKDPIIPDGFILKIDTREQIPLFDKPLKGLPIIRDTLKHGDYSIVGFENQICIERKQMSDFLSYVGSDRSNTKKKLEAMQLLTWKGLVIEEHWEELFFPKLYSAVHVESIRKSLVSFSIKYHLHIFVNSNREECTRWILDRLIYFYKLQRGV